MNKPIDKNVSGLDVLEVKGRKSGINKVKYGAATKSLWVATANSAPHTDPINESRAADVVIIGAGYLGITAAITLAVAGATVVVLENGNLGEGASGLNGGQVIQGLKPTHSKLIQMYGLEHAERVITFANTSVDLVFDLIKQHEIECDARRVSWLQPAMSPRNMDALAVRVNDCNQWAGNAALMNAIEVSELLGSRPDAYCGGWVNHNAGSIHPLNYLLGLTNAAIKSGVDVYTQSQAVKLTKSQANWRIETARGPSITAKNVLLATNAYADNLWPRLKESIVAARSLQIATEPLPSEMLHKILPQLHTVSESRRVMNYYRLSPEGRLLYGGRGPFGDEFTVRSYDGLINAMRNIFPQTQDISVDFAWSGKVAMTRDYLPHIHQPDIGIWAAVGCNGRGVGLMSALGTAIGKQIMGDKYAHPFTTTAIKRLPFHQLNHVYASALIQYYRFLDKVI